ncbi:M23 family metallopeptidase [Chryseolinea sp. T2]|uniref:M23 family metallopeptidase n=1 Tax=Chryseolinea sp. T2 TaxID=3129255 RepID=UPI003078288C
MSKLTANPARASYRPNGRTRLRKVIFAALTVYLTYAFYTQFILHFGPVEDQILLKENLRLKAEMEIVEERIEKSSVSLEKLIDRDDHNYRVVLDTDPLSPEIRSSGSGGSERFDRDALREAPNLVVDYSTLDKLQSRLTVEEQSYEELNELLNERIRMWSSRPAIQPINNKQLNQLFMTYGPRMHPIFNVMKDHNGLDFSAPKGTPVYATGDGVILTAHRSSSYGKVIYIDHGHGYETRYAHLSKFIVSEGDRVKRGQVIGYVGSTGTSQSAHLHYEVLVNSKHVNPINFFQRDLSNSEYERLIEIAQTQSQPLD